MTFLATLELKLPPLLVAVLVGGLMWLFAQAVPSPALPGWLQGSLALFLAGAGVAVAVAGVLAFRRAQTTVNPTRPEATTALVVNGVYRFTRNPMYMGFLLWLLAFGLMLNNLGALIVGGGLFHLYLNRFQIVPEERWLLAHFGDDYRRYCAQVRRWL